MAIGFLKTGNSAKQAIAQQEAEAELRKLNKDAQRYWMKEGTEGKITFLDGPLDSDGTLLAPMYYEHNLKLNGNWGNYFVCIQEQEACPLCAMGNNWPSLVAVFSIIDHRSYKDSSGKEWKDQKRLFVCKTEVYKRLHNKATKLGGLVGVTFNVARIGDKSANVGSDFEFSSKHTIPELAQILNKTVEDLQPFDYNKVIVYRDAKELQKMGLGSVSALGAGDSPFKHVDESAQSDYSSKL